MLCVAQNHRLQAHRHCCLTWIFCVKWNMRDQDELMIERYVRKGMGHLLSVSS